MARWRLMVAHYLNVPGTEWERIETSMESGEQGRTRYTVPRFLEEGTIVCYKNPGKKEFVFTGPPTPDMEPLDEEAEEITETFKSQWVHPIESLSGNGSYGADLIAAFERQMQQMMQSNVGKPVSVSANQVSKEDFERLQEQVAALMARNAELEAEPRRRA